MMKPKTKKQKMILQGFTPTPFMPSFILRRFLKRKAVPHAAQRHERCGGFTLIETLIAISLLLLAVVEPMTLTEQSLKSAYYARDQITASNLAQEAIEAVRSVRDGQILQIVETGATVDIFGPIPVDKDFTIDTTNSAMIVCSGTCPPLQTDGVLYGYNVGWANTGFIRTVHACYVQPGSPSAGCNSTVSDEMRLTVTVTWRTGSYPARSLVIHENLYRWVNNT